MYIFRIHYKQILMCWANYVPKRTCNFIFNILMCVCIYTDMHKCVRINASIFSKSLSDTYFT